MTTPCPVCGTRFNEPNHQCFQCNFPFKEYNNIDETLDLLKKINQNQEESITKIHSNIETIIIWSKSLYSNKSNHQFRSQEEISKAEISSDANLTDLSPTETTSEFSLATTSFNQQELQNITNPVNWKETALLVANTNILLENLTPIVQEIKKSQLQTENQWHNQFQEIKVLLTNIYQSLSIQNKDENNQTNDKNISQISTVSTLKPNEDNSQVTSSDSSSINIPWLSEYNQNPASFGKYQYIPLSITADTIHNGRMGVNQPVILENQRNGNYWIFIEDNTTTKGKYLVPKANLKINEYALETLKLLFNVNEDNLGNYSKLIVTEPALVISIDQDKWQLVELGILQLESDN